MDKSDFRCVETLPFYAGECFAVYVIAQQRMTQIRQMNPNLMGPPGFQPQAQMRCTGIFSNHGIVCDCWFGILLCNAHFFAVNRMSADRRMDRAFRFPKASHGNCLVLPCEGMGCDLC